MKKIKEIFSKAVVENPIFVLILGICPVLKASNTLDRAFGMSIAVLAVLILTNVIISCIRKIVPNEIRIPVYIIIIATVVTVVKLLMNAFMPQQINDLIGSLISMIVVNCIILGRAESYASKNNVLDSFLDAIGIGLGFLIAICSLAAIREFIGTNGLVFTNPFTGKEVFSFDIADGKYAIPIFTENAGAFFAFGFMMAIVNAFSISKQNKQKTKELEAKKQAVLSAKSTAESK